LHTNEFASAGSDGLVRYAKPHTLDEALALLSEAEWRVLAGGTDFYPALGARPLREDVLDINGLDELRGVSEARDAVVIGARTTWSDIVRQPLPAAFAALKQAAKEVGSVQIQNTGTVAGNLCNASPAADGVPALLILDAEVEIASVSGSRTEPLATFIRGNRKTGLRRNELVTAIRVPKTSFAGTSSFYKLGSRRYLVISIAMAAVRLAVEDGIVREAAVAVGACSAVAQRLRELEVSLVGREALSIGVKPPAEQFLAPLTPIDDVRGSADYRRAAAREIVGRALAAAARAACGDDEPPKECAA
jgi:CO/xanthine dehydrogenase FAD-binding subunit